MRGKIQMPYYVLTGYEDSWKHLCSTLSDFEVNVDREEQVDINTQILNTLNEVVKEIKNLGNATPVYVQQPVPAYTPAPAPTPAPTPIPKQAPTPSPTVQESNQAPVESNVVPEPVQPQAVAEQPAESDEDAELAAKYAKVQEIMKKIENADSSEFAGSDSVKVSDNADDKKKLLTEDVRKEKDIAEKSQELLEAWDM